MGKFTCRRQADIDCLANSVLNFSALSKWELKCPDFFWSVWVFFVCATILSSLCCVVCFKIYFEFPFSAIILILPCFFQRFYLFRNTSALSFRAFFRKVRCLTNKKTETLSILGHCLIKVRQKLPTCLPAYAQNRKRSVPKQKKSIQFSHQFILLFTENSFAVSLAKFCDSFQFQFF